VPQKITMSKSNAQGAEGAANAAPSQFVAGSAGLKSNMP